MRVGPGRLLDFDTLLVNEDLRDSQNEVERLIEAPGAARRNEQVGRKVREAQA
jgi:hypothetical protein